ncbi:MAG: hypothetical protein A3A86_08270 [Elusimicrobia bacterium RIFCSPLOWO2_01_FULL_60_11]|nr:MAG: hypothetical protein A3A86_08270 [Elusimicrobia bacterium RIFCSPLOWO2_01_FULL_60_11]
MSFSTQPPRLNEVLKLNRERRRASLQTVHQDTRISLTYLEMLEAGQYDKFPAEVYCLGFMRKYAAYLGMDPEEAVAQYRQEQEAVKAVAKQEEDKRSETEKKEKSTDMAKVLTLLLLLILVGGWWLFTIVRSSSKRETRRLPSIAQRGMAPVTPPLSDRLTLTARARESVWMRVTPDKKLDFEGFVAAGSTRTWEANDEFFIRIGNVAAVSLTLNGMAVDTGSGAVQSVNEMVLDRASLASRPETPQ